MKSFKLKEFELQLIASLDADYRRRQVYNNSSMANININYTNEARNMAKNVTLNVLGALTGMPLLLLLEDD